MEAFITTYAGVITSYGFLGAMVLLQLIVADISGIRAGHTPGMPVDAGHDSFLFRAARAHANSNESAPAFVLLTLFAILTGAHPAWLNGLALAYVLCRLGHMLAYYTNLKVARSAAFALSLLALTGILVTALL